MQRLEVIGTNPKLLFGSTLHEPYAAAPDAALSLIGTLLNPTGRASVPLHLLVVASDVESESSGCGCLCCGACDTKWTYFLALSSQGEVVCARVGADGNGLITGRAPVADVILKQQHRTDVLLVETTTAGKSTWFDEHGQEHSQVTASRHLGIIGSFDAAHIAGIREKIQQVLNEMVEAGVTGRLPVTAASSVVNTTIVNTTVVNNTTIVASSPLDMARNEA